MPIKVDKQKLTWKAVVRDALLELGGQGHLSEINKIVEDHPKTKTNPTWRDTIRRVVRQYKIFEPVPPERSGIYKVVEEVLIRPESQGFTKEPEIDHGIAQGMLVTLGRIYGYETYAPFRFYKELEELYNSALVHNDQRKQFGTIERWRQL